MECRREASKRQGPTKRPCMNHTRNMVHTGPLNSIGHSECQANQYDTDNHNDQISYGLLIFTVIVIRHSGMEDCPEHYIAH